MPAIKAACRMVSLAVQSIACLVLAIVTRCILEGRAMCVAQAMAGWRRDGLARVDENSSWYQTTAGNRARA